MFTTGQWIFGILFFIAFVIAVAYQYRKDLKIHNINNLYVNGSSNFVTAGYTNPTFTIVQMALKLSEHITKEVLS